MKCMNVVVIIITGAFLFGCSLAQRAMPGATLSSANVMSVMDTIDRSEIEAAQLAQEKAASADVRAYAARLLQEHDVMSDKHRLLTQQINVQSEKPALAETLEKTHHETMEELRKQSGSAFDHAYLSYQINMHEQAIDLVHDAAGSADNSRLRKHFTQVRPNLESHLSAARAIERQVVASADAALPDETTATPLSPPPQP